ncbi:MAG: trehalose-6-phosphate synthase [Candidatus Obscuribacterales bacterium]|nr:trehalose-6-phosphate synthase [Candidatus Obscuribacterales bacterium]
MFTATKQPHLLSPLTPEDLGQLQVQLPALNIFSYRGPGQSGGVASSLAPLTRQLGTKVQWIALSGVPEPDDRPIAGFSFYKPDVPEEIINRQGQAVHNYLWPLFHGIEDKIRYDAEEWKNFRQLSVMLAHQSQRIAMRSFPTLVWLHDFEMALLAPLLSMDAGVILAHFWHVPWPSPELMKKTPAGLEITEALLSNRLLGFHTEEYADNFLRTVEELIPDATVDFVNLTVKYHGRTTTVLPMPLGLDYPYWQRLARGSKLQAEALPVTHRLAHQIILGVDRIDYTKGILEKLDGVEKFLAENPDYYRRCHYVQLAQPFTPNTDFTDYLHKVRERVKAINTRFRKDSWEPIVWMEGYFDHQQLSAWYQAADVLAVTPVRDGLNLIAKEYIACRLDEQGAIVLGEKAGCASELISGAILIDSENSDTIAAGIQQALSMGVEEKRRRMVSMRHVVAWNRLHDWACGFLRQALASPR